MTALEKIQNFILIENHQYTLHMKKFFLSALCITSFQLVTNAQTQIPICPQVTSFTSMVRGYHFISPTTFTICGLWVADNMSTGTQNVEVVKFNSAAPPAWPGTTNAFTSLFYQANYVPNTMIPCSITINTGDIIGIYGARTSSMINSYGGYGGCPISILGFPTTTYRSGMQFNLSTQQMHDIWSETWYYCGRIFMYVNCCPQPPAPGPITGNLNVCPGLTENYSIPPVSTAVSYTWTVPAGYTINSGQNTPSINVTIGNIGGQICVSYNDGCQNSPQTCVTLIITVPTVTITPLNPGYCINNGVVNLSGTPVGGTFSGTGVVGSTFDPLLAGAGGPYWIYYDYTDPAGCHNADSTQVTVYALPNPTINPISSAYCVNAPAVALSGNPAGGSFTGIGVSAGMFNPAAAGVGGPYVITYTYTDANGCTNNTTTQVTVNALPVVTINAINPAYCVDAAPFNLVGNPGGGTFTGAGMTGSTFTAASAGVGGPYTIQYNYTDPNGCSGSSSTTVSVNALPVVTATPAIDTICSGNSIMLHGGGALTYSWAPNTNLSATTGDSVSANPLVTTTYTVTGTDVNSCTNTATSQVNVKPTPTSTFTMPANLCFGDSALVTYTGTAGVTAAFTWNFGGSSVATGTGAGPYHIQWPAPGNYTVTLDVSDINCPSVTTTHNITVDQIPTSTFSATPDTLCAGETASINFTGTASPGSFFAWNFNGGSTTGSGAGPYNVIWTNPGPKTVTLMVTTGICNSFPTNVSVQVDTVPTVSLIGTPLIGCVPITVSFTSTGSNGSVYTWDFGDGSTSTSMNPIHVYNSTGTFNVKLSVTSVHGCSDSTIQMGYVTVLPQPVASFSSMPDTASYVELNDATFTFTNNSTNFTNVIWNFGDGGSSTLLNPTHQYTQTGTYTVTLVVFDTLGTCADSVIMFPYVISPNGNVFIPNAFSPNEDGINDIIKVEGVGIESGVLKIYDRWGEMVFITTDYTQGWDGKFNGQKMNQGVYIALAEIQLLNGQHLSLRGDVTIIK